MDTNDGIPEFESRVAKSALNVPDPEHLRGSFSLKLGRVVGMGKRRNRLPSLRLDPTSFPCSRRFEIEAQDSENLSDADGVRKHRVTPPYRLSSSTDAVWLIGVNLEDWMDKKLNRAIAGLLEAAADSQPRLANIRDMAEMLHTQYPHRSVDEILERLKGEWRARGMFWDE